MRRNSWISVFASTMIAGLPIVGALAVASTLASAAAEDSDTQPATPQSLFGIITNSASTDTQRLNAAVDLVNLDSTNAQKLVLKGLSKDADPNGRIALAKALAAVSKPDAQYVAALGSMLGPNSKQTKCAAAALANYGSDSAAFGQLKTFVDAVNNPADSRVEAVRAMGTLIDQDPAHYLVTLVGAPNQTQSIRDAAAAALAEMTGDPTNGNNAAQWQKWWTNAGALKPREFHGLLMEGRAKQAAKFQQLQAAFADLLNNDYYSAPTDARKAELVLKYLNSDSPIVRVAVVQLINENLDHRSPTAEERDRLVEMIGDADDKVRLSVVDVLRDSTKLKDAPQLLPKLTARLLVEKSAQVKIHIIQALGKFGLSKGAGAVAALLNDPDMDVRIAAAKALSGTLGSNYRHDDAAGADVASAAVYKIVKENIGVPGTEELRAACIGAMAALQSQGVFEDLMNMHLWLPGESPEVRRATFQALGVIGNKAAGEVVKGQLEDKDATIKLEAARAMRTLAKPEDELRILDRMRNDQDPAVRQALWQALYKLYDDLPTDDLVRDADLFNRPPDKDPDKRLATLLKLGEAYNAKHQSEPYARNQQDVAQAMMEVTPPQSTEAIKNLREAITYWRNTGKDTPTLMNTLIGDLLDDLLKSGQYAEAAKFGAEQIAIKPEYHHTVDPLIKNKADELSQSDPAAAKALIDEALKMSPALDENIVHQLQQIQDRMKRQHP